MSNKVLIPRLRFPQFKDTWQPKQLGEVFTYTPRAIQKPAIKYTAIGIRSHFKGTFQKPNSEPEKTIWIFYMRLKKTTLL